MPDLWGQPLPGESADAPPGPPTLPPSPVAPPPPAEPSPSPPGILNRSWNSVVGGLKAIDDALGFDTKTPPGGWDRTNIQNPVFNDAGNAGSMRAIRNVADPINERVAQGAEALRLVAPGTADATAQQNQKDLADYNAKFGEHPVAGAFKTAGEFGLTSYMLGGLGNMVSQGVSKISPALSDAVDLLIGNKASATSAPAKIAETAVQGSAQGAGGAALTTGGSDKPASEQIASGATTGAWLGPLFHYGAQGLTALGGLTGSIPEHLTDLARKADDLGIPINWQKFNENPVFRYVQDKLGVLPGAGKTSSMPFTERAPSDADGVAAVHDRLNDLIGESGPRITQDNMDSAATKSENTMDAVANRTTLKADPQFNTGLAAVENNAKALGDQGSTALNTIAEIRAQMANPNTGAGPGTMSGTDYRNLTQAKGGIIAQRTGDGASLSDQYMHQIEDHLDNLFHRSAAPGDAADLTDALTKYRIIKTLQPAVEASAGTGVLNPSTLASTVRQQSRRWDPSTGGIAYGQDNPDLAQLSDLSNVYKTFFGPTKASQVGSEGKGLSGEVGAFGGAAALEGAGRYFFDKPGLAAWAIPPLAVNAAAQRLMRGQQVSQNILQSSINPQVRQAAELQARLAANQMVRGATLSGVPQEVPPTAAGLLGY